MQNSKRRDLPCVDVCGRHGVTARSAFRLGRLLGTTPLFWMNLQANWDLWHIQQEEAATASNVGGITMENTGTHPWDAADYLKTEEDIVASVDAAFEDGDPALIAAALGDVARARGMTRVAADAGLGRESLYKTLSAGGNPGLATIIKVMRALGLRLRAAGTESAAPETRA